MKNRPTRTVSSTDKLSVSYRSRDLITNVLTSFSDAVILTDPDFNVTGWNPAAEKLYGKKVDDAKGKLLFEIINISFPGTTLTGLMSQLNKKGFWNGEVIYDRFDHQRFFLNTSATLIYNDINIISGIVIVTRNVTTERLKDEKLIQAETKYQTVIDTLSEGVLMLNADGKIGASNKRAAEILGLSQEELPGRITADPNRKAVKEDGSVLPMNEFPAIIMLQTGQPQKSVTLGIEQPGGKTIWLLVNSQAIIENDKTVAVVASFSDITAIKYANDRIKESEALLRTFMNNSSAHAWICDEDGYLIYFNSLFAATHHLKEGEPVKHIRQVFSEKIADKFLRNNKKFFETGEPALIVTEADRADGSHGQFSIYRFNIPVKSLKRLIGFQAIDTTEHLDAAEALRKSNDRFFHIANATSDAIWDQDLQTGEIYRSSNFSKLSGYSMEEIQSDMDWWFMKIHPEDRERVKKKILDNMNDNQESREDQYRFLCADGGYKTFFDKGFFIYRDGKPVRIIGAIQDITERKKLEDQLMNEKIKQQRLLNKTAISAQEAERDNISKELHDNVNQLLMSTKLYIHMARKQPDKAEDMLAKAEEYQLSAVEEIRKLSKKLNSSLVKVLGLKNSIQEIVHSMQQTNDIPVTFEFDDFLDDTLFDEQKLMLFRIVQEQSNNIRKYAHASRAGIHITQKGDKVHLMISDDGIGFKMDEVKSKGIGLTNISNRVNVLNGEFKIESYPGNGCTLYVSFPVYS